MAYAVLVSLAQTIEELLHHHNDHYSISLHQKQQIISIHENILSLQAFLEDFPEKATSLEGRIRDVANQAEDIIEYFQTLCQELRQVTEEIGSITEEVMMIKKGSRTEEAQLSDSSVTTSSSRPITPTNKDSMVGFDDDLMAIKARLCGESSNLQVIPIFGMGGIGKTTLARNAYDDPLTLEHFHISAWVTVSLDYSTQEILSGLLDSMKVESSRHNIELMRELVCKRLKGRKYLIVMDDMWSTKAWDDVKMVFPDDHNGSRIMLTTRLSDVATYPNSSSPLHKMGFMNADQSWSLLQQKVFCPPELEIIGKEIAKSCRGLPLAIVLIAGILSTVSKSQASWRYISENVNLAIRTRNDEQFAKIVLSFSYIQLPHHLRPCFLYMGGFPEDYEIHVSKLMKIWVAEGFLKPIGSKSSEEVAEEYVEDLVRRSLVLVSSRKTNGKIKSCSIHDLVRDLCIRKAQEEKFLLNLMDRYVSKISPKNIKSQRRITVGRSDMDSLGKIDGSTIHTIICFQDDGNSLSSVRNFRLLRILDVVPDKSGIFIISRLPAEVFELLIHLRYFAFIYREQSVFPLSILNHQNLQTLIIFPIWSLHRPLEIWRMPQLRHLRFIGTLADIPQGAATFALENLQTLCGVKNFKCTEEVLKMIPNLKKLGVTYVGEEYGEDSHLENLVYLHQLEKIKLNVYLSFPFKGKLNLVFPMTLKKLSLSGCRLPWKDMGIVGSLPNLQVLKLRNFACFGDKWETSEEEFPQLKFLLIDHSDLQDWITESSHFPSLKWLALYRCWCLSEIPDDIGKIPTLELIEVDDQNKYLLDSAKQIQEELQENCGDVALQVRLGSTWKE